VSRHRYEVLAAHGGPHRRQAAGISPAPISVVSPRGQRELTSTTPSVRPTASCPPARIATDPDSARCPPLTHPPLSFGPVPRATGPMTWCACSAVQMPPSRAEADCSPGVRNQGVAVSAGGRGGRSLTPPYVSCHEPVQLKTQAGDLTDSGHSIWSSSACRLRALQRITDARS